MLVVHDLDLAITILRFSGKYQVCQMDPVEKHRART